MTTKKIYPSYKIAIYLYLIWLLNFINYLLQAYESEKHKLLLIAWIIFFIVLLVKDVLEIFVWKKYLPIARLCDKKIDVQLKEGQDIYEEILFNQIEKLNFDKKNHLAIRLKNEKSIYVDLQRIDKISQNDLLKFIEKKIDKQNN